MPTPTSVPLSKTRRGLGLLKKYGYLPYDKEPTKETVAKGLEYALADACLVSRKRSSALPRVLLRRDEIQPVVGM